MTRKRLGDRNHHQDPVVGQKLGLYRKILRQLFPVAPTLRALGFDVAETRGRIVNRRENLEASNL